MNAKLALAMLAEPFPVSAVGWKPGVVSGQRALAMPYIDARDVIDRLNAVLPLAWSATYRQFGKDDVICTITVNWECRVLNYEDVGNPSDTEPSKGAFSDAFKRAAVKMGVGRYLYSLPQEWVDYDTAKRTFVKTPALPDSAKPRSPEGMQALWEIFAKSGESWEDVLQEQGWVSSDTPPRFSFLRLLPLPEWIKLCQRLKLAIARKAEEAGKKAAAASHHVEPDEIME